jgi:hypothetical protein
VADDGMPYPGVSQLETAADWEAFFTAVQLDGVVSGLAPTINSGARTASLGAGSAYLRGFYKPVASTTATAVPAASGQDRVDRLVLRLDRDAATAATYIVPTVLTGTAGAGTPPALTRGSTGAWDLPISRWMSRSSGALTDPVDERYGPTWYTSAARSAGLVSAAPARTSVETDTGLLYRSDGTTWTVLLQDTGWVPLSISAASEWTQVGTVAARRVGSTVNVVFEGRRTHEFNIGDPNGSGLVTLPADMKPAAQRFGTGLFTSGSVVRIIAGPSGSVVIDRPNVNVPIGADLRCGLTFMI